ncbi:hypothetical protein [Streptomyces brasiliensis]|uniref:Uncharacterized protein n=1 Tax=Streptomyces brasiliensis TaxID=1954 RepID=A0A917P6B8_9ACTN|nr:hypothetical protein [Streptomyces brasiliensis]GGJ63798.1 hypothetical protein GCM10010121_088050 [Streptomyces brasiliensis]
MITNRANAAQFIARQLPQPHETDFGGELVHELLATTHADWVCPPSGHSISWADCYAGADILPLTHKAALLLEPNGEPRPIPEHVTGEARKRAKRAVQHAVWLWREAHRRGLPRPQLAGGATSAAAPG